MKFLYKPGALRDQFFDSPKIRFFLKIKIYDQINLNFIFLRKSHNLTLSSHNRSTTRMEIITNYYSIVYKADVLVITSVF